MEGHKHSPGDAAQGEDYPIHLVASITTYNKLMSDVEENQPTVSQQNYKVQDAFVGIPSPIGNDTNAEARASTRDQNARAGINLVMRDKTAMAYPSPNSGLEDDNVNSPSKSKNKKAKFNVKDLISSTNQCRSDMSSAIIDLASSTKKETASSEEIAFKKGIWDDKKIIWTRNLRRNSPTVRLSLVLKLIKCV